MPAKRRRRECKIDEPEELEVCEFEFPDIDKIRRESARARASAVEQAAKLARDKPEKAMKVVADAWEQCNRLPMRIQPYARRGLVKRLLNNPRVLLAVTWNAAFTHWPDREESPLYKCLPWVDARDGFSRAISIQSLPPVDKRDSAQAIIASYDHFAYRTIFQWFLNDVGPDFVTKLKRTIIEHFTSLISRSTPLIPDLARIIAVFCGTMDCMDYDVYQLILQQGWNLRDEYEPWMMWVGRVYQEHPL